METIPQFLTGASITNLLGLIINNGVERRFWLRAVEAIMYSLLLTPFYFLESLYVKIVPRPPMHPAPVFVIGHWRSGTTYLHYLLSKDTQFACCTNVDAFTPGSLFVGRWLLRKVISMRLPETRPMDNVQLDAAKPQEDEFPMMMLTSCSFYHSFAFPKSIRQFFFNYVVFDPQNVNLIHQWKKSYFQYLSKLSSRYKNKQLLLKNPVNTARIKYLVGLFPNAKFIYIHRSPKEVKLSTLRMFKAIIASNCLQSFDEAEVRANIEIFHNRLINEYETHRHFIDENNLVEVSYSDLIEKPLDTVEKIYQTLKLGNFDHSKSAFVDFIADQSRYQPHNYDTTTLKL